MTYVSDHVAGLGVPTFDGAIGEIVIDTGAGIAKEVLVWQAAQQAWVSRRPRYSMRQIGPFGMLVNAYPGSVWTYPGASEGAYGIDNSFGFQIHKVKNAKHLCAAGLRLQEHLSAFTKAGANAGELGLCWFDEAPGDVFLAPPPTNFGVLLPTSADPFHWRFVSTGWQNSPANVAVNGAYYPELYGKDDGVRFRKFCGRYRWTSTPTSGLGGAETSGGQPPKFDWTCSWLVADNVPRADGGLVDTWPDYSGYSRSLIQNVQARQPILVRNALNGHAVVRFDGVDDFLQVSNAIDLFTQPLTYFIVLKQYAGGPAQQVWHEGGPGESRPILYRADGVNKVDLWAGAGADVTYNRSAPWPSPYVCFSFVTDGASSNVWENKTLKVVGNPGAFGSVGMTLGAAQDGTLAAQVDIAEVIVYYAGLNDSERNAVIDYLNAKYNLF